MRNFFGPGLKNLSFFIIAGFLLGSDFIAASKAMERDEKLGRASQNVLSIKTQYELDDCLNNKDFFQGPFLKIKGFTPSLKDLTTIINLPSLRALDLSGLDITEMPDLTNARALEELNIADTFIENIDQIAKAPILRLLNLAHTKIVSLSPLKDMRIESVNLCGTQVRIFSSSIGMSPLDIEYVPVDFAEVATFKNLRQVIIGMNPPPPLKLMSELNIKDLTNARRNTGQSNDNNNCIYVVNKQHLEYEKKLEGFQNNLLKLKERRPDLDIQIRECETPHI